MFKWATFLSKYFDLFGLKCLVFYGFVLFIKLDIDIIVFIILMTKGKTPFLLFNFLSPRLV